MKIRLLLALVLMTFSVFGQNVPSYVPSNGLVGWWPFNGNANDESGNGNNGTVNGATLTSDRFGNLNKAYDFDGVDDFILLNPYALNLPISYSFWIKADSLIDLSATATQSNSGATIISLGASNNPCNYCDFGTGFKQGNYGVGELNCTTAQWLESEYGSGCNYNYVSNCNPSVQISFGWQQITVVMEPNLMKRYFNGILLDSIVNTVSSLNNSGFPLSFGARYVANMPGMTLGEWKGKIDDICIWDRVLTQQEIANYYNAPNPNTSIPIFNCPSAFVSPQLASGLVGWWPFCGDADDESGNGNNGTVNGATLTSDRFGNGNSAYEFDGIDDKIELGAIPNANYSSNASFSHSLWVRPDGIKFGRILSFTSTLSGDLTFVHQLTYEPNGIISFNCAQNTGSANPPYAQVSSGTMASNQWHHIVLTYSANNLNIYVNESGSSNVLYSGPLCLDGVNSELHIGYTPIEPTERFGGIIDDFGSWNRALDSSEVAQLYNTGLCTQTIAGSCDTLIFNANITGFNPVTYANQVKVYPNPASDNLVIDCGTNYTGLNGYSIRITNLLGQTAYNSPVTAQITNIQLTPPTWVNGTYVVQFVHPNGTVVDTKRIIIQ